jgi:hypothetical protein
MGRPSKGHIRAQLVPEGERTAVGLHRSRFLASSGLHGNAKESVNPSNNGIVVEQEVDVLLCAFICHCSSPCRDFWNIAAY